MTRMILLSPLPFAVERARDLILTKSGRRGGECRAHEFICSEDGWMRDGGRWNKDARNGASERASVEAFCKFRA